MVKLADKIFTDTQSGAVNAFSVAAVATNQNLDETQPAMAYPVPEVAAVRGAGRGRGRGRGGRNNRGGRGRGSSSGQPRHTGTKHPDLPEGDWKGCGMHFKFGKNAYFCSEPSTCPWKNVFVTRPAKQ